jgi:hypothetical protein
MRKRATFPSFLLFEREEKRNEEISSMPLTTYSSSMQIVLSLGMYVAGPQCRHFVAGRSALGHVALTCALALVTAGLLLQQSILLTSAFVCTLVLITFICPMWLVRIHKFKAQINGPWDEAVPNISNAYPLSSKRD